eukprot:2030905-Prymnesium_polylepis.1
MGDAADERVPVTILTGFLGSGKTTLLNHILTANHGKKVCASGGPAGQHMHIAVIENEFGEVGVDDALVRERYNTTEDIFEMNNGCICCTHCAGARRLDSDPVEALPPQGHARRHHRRDDRPRGACLRRPLSQPAKRAVAQRAALTLALAAVARATRVRPGPRAGDPDVLHGREHQGVCAARRRRHAGRCEAHRAAPRRGEARGRRERGGRAGRAAARRA